MKNALLAVTLVGIVSVLDGCGGGSPPFFPATHFSVTPSTSTPASGTAFVITVTAVASTGQTATSYSGTVHFSSSDGQALLPSDSPMTGVTGTFSVTLNTAGPQTVTVSDTASLMGMSSTVNVGPGAAAHFLVTPANYVASIGTAISFTITAVDAVGNTATSYSGTVHFTSSDAQAVLPADSTLTNGTGTFSITPKTSGNQTITATDKALSSINGTSGTISVSGPATHFSINAATTATTRKYISIGVNALDASNNTSTGYTGTVHITTTDSNAILPANAALQTGSGNFQVTLETAGTQTVTATDTVTASITGTSSSIAVTATAPLMITSGSPPNGTVGSTYGTISTQYLKCTVSLFRRTCTPCVPNTAACGGSYPRCPSPSLFGTCVLREDFSGFELTASGGVPAYNWTASALPPGLAVNTQHGRMFISGTPTPGTAATYNAMVTLNDSGLPPTPMIATYPIVISNPPPPVVSTSPLLPGATVNQPFSYTFTATAGLPPYSNWKETGTLPAGIAPLTGAGVLAGTPTMTGPFPITVTVDDSLGQVSVAQAFNFQVYAHGFKAAGTMGAARMNHTATLLQDGSVLLAGGLGLASAEIFNASTGVFAATTGSMSVSRQQHTATLLSSGKVLIAGGSNGSTSLATAEIFDPSTGKFTLTTGNLNVARTGHNATLLTSGANGKVLITGGGTATAELFDPSTGMFTPTKGAMVTARANETATLLANGKVLITGGFGASGELATAELYDPATDMFTATGTMTVARGNQTATLLNSGPNSGKVLIAAGNNISSAELYDPTAGTFSTTGSMATARAYHAAILLGDGTVLMVGGFDANNAILAAVELYDPNSGTFAGTGGLQTPRAYDAAALLKDGSTVLVTGGTATGAPLASAEEYQ